ncbi:MAG: flagellar hook-associated protein FlgK [Peptococcaceae bacterium]|jgi:flagellar hook-associated protein 1 FlgK|nr:flagellar hook-associated protein FlgK [Peptococcaceae bacterium]
MIPTFFGLELALRALETQQSALNTSGHNIANANAVGYSRQLTDMKATLPYVISYNGKDISLGSGVTVASIERARDVFVDRQYRLEFTKGEYWVSRADLISKVETVFNESSEYSISGDLDRFWAAYNDLATNPENTGARSVVQGRAIALTDTFHYVAQQLDDMQRNINDNILNQVDQINLYAEQIKELNMQIKNAQIVGDFPNDLLDRRDNLVDELSKIANITVIEQRDPRFTDRMVNTYTLVIGSETAVPKQVLVQDQEATHLKAGVDANGFAMIQWAIAGTDLDLGAQKGLLLANIEVRDNYIPAIRAELDKIAQGVANAINALHQTGQGMVVETDGISLFTDGVTADTPGVLPSGITAANITLNQLIQDNPLRIATGAINAAGVVKSGDATVASAIASLRDGWAALTDMMGAGVFGAAGQKPLDAVSISDFYNAFIAGIGVNVQTADRMAVAQEMLVYQLAVQREAVSGVNLDEEMTNLVKYQKSYTAAARLVTMFDDMLETIVKGMGITR